MKKLFAFAIVSLSMLTVATPGQSQTITKKDINYKRATIVDLGNGAVSGKQRYPKSFSISVLLTFGGILSLRALMLLFAWAGSKVAP